MGVRSTTIPQQASSSTPPAAVPPAPAAALKGRPIAPRPTNFPTFEMNAGQFDPEVKFLVRAKDHNCFLTSTGATIVLSGPTQSPTSDALLLEQSRLLERRVPGPVVEMKIAGLTRHASVEGIGETPSKSNYFIGRDPKRWRTNVSSFEKVQYRDVYKGVDLVFRHNEHKKLEFDFIVAPYADWRQIGLQFNGTSGMRISSTGDLVLDTPGGELIYHRPIAYQESANKRSEIPAKFVRLDNEIRFDIGTHDPSLPLIIDPVIVYSTYLGGSGSDRVLDIELDATGATYVVGMSDSPDFPGSNAEALPLFNAFISKITPAGTLAFTTYIGSNGVDAATAVTFDPHHNIYVAGFVFPVGSDPGFPTMVPYQATIGSTNGHDMFILKLGRNGDELIYSTYLGGVSGEIATDIAVDSEYRAVISGYTKSGDFPVRNALQSENGTPGHFQNGSMQYGYDGIVAKLSASGSALEFATYIGGLSEERAKSLALGSDGTIYVTGTTESRDFPTRNPLEASKGGFSDSFVTRLAADGSSMIFSTYLSGSTTPGTSTDARAIAVDANGSAYIAGYTDASDFVLQQPYQPVLAGARDAFVVKLSASGQSRSYATFIGGESVDEAYDIAVDGGGSAYITGGTYSQQFPEHRPLYDSANGDYSAFVSVLRPGGDTLQFSSLLGGNASDTGYAIAARSGMGIFLAGVTASTDFPIVNALQQNFAGGAGDGFVTKLAEPSVFLR